MATFIEQICSLSTTIKGKSIEELNEKKTKSALTKLRKQLCLQNNLQVAAFLAIFEDSMSQYKSNMNDIYSFLNEERSAAHRISRRDSNPRLVAAVENMAKIGALYKDNLLDPISRTRFYIPQYILNSIISDKPIELRANRDDINRYKFVKTLSDLFEDDDVSFNEKMEKMRTFEDFIELPFINNAKELIPDDEERFLFYEMCCDMTNHNDMSGKTDIRVTLKDLYADNYKKNIRSHQIIKRRYPSPYHQRSYRRKTQ